MKVTLFMSLGSSLNAGGDDMLGYNTTNNVRIAVAYVVQKCSRTYDTDGQLWLPNVKKAYLGQCI